MNIKDKRIRLSRQERKLLLSNLLLFLGIVYRPILQVCLGAVAVLSVEYLFETNSRGKESRE